MDKGLKKEILTLRNEGKSYKEIVKLLSCSSGVVSYHCKKEKLNDLGLGGKFLTKIEIDDLKIYYKDHTTKECAKKFNISLSTVKKFIDKKRKIFTLKEQKEKNYEHVKLHRQRMKLKVVDYKGGKCEKCGYNKSIWSLHFHHINPSKKDFVISQYAYLSWEKIKNEIEKCILVCGNCHGEVHEELYNKKNSLVSPLSDKQ